MPAKKKTSEAIKVVFRIRPLSSKEIQDGRTITTKAHEDRGSIEICNPKIDGGTKQFSFDAVFSENVSQRKIYDTCAAPVVQSVLDGYNGTVFAYGQTGAGKTHTMEGVTADKELRGIIPNAFQHIFDHVSLKGSDETYLVRASYFEIYNEEIRDLLSSNPKASLELKESVDSGVYVKGLTSKVVKSFGEIDYVMQLGKKNRSVASTLMNAGSSRSHSVFSIIVECCVKDANGEDHIRVGKLNLVDLAGSERQGKTGATGDRLKEATKINLSLSALGNVISALVDGKNSHVPYRDSKLTRILQDSLGGNTKTVMCANAGPAEYNYDETLSTLRYANRAKNIKNKPIINEDPKDTMLREYQEQIAQLKRELSGINMDGRSVQSSSIIETEKKEIHEIEKSHRNNQMQEEKLRKLEQQAAKERAELLARSGEEMNKLQSERKQSDEERKILESKLQEQSRSKKEIEKQRLSLQQKLQDMEAQLMIGGEMASKATKQEAELRKAQQDLIAKREQELIQARKISEREEANIVLEEQYNSLQEACQSITKKLKKLWKRYQQAKGEITDLNGEFQMEREGMLNTIRDLEKLLKLKNLVIDNFVPPRYAPKFDEESKGGLAKWNESSEEWFIPNLDLACNNNPDIIEEIPTAHKEGFRPETQYSKHMKVMDPDPRWRHDNILQLDLDFPQERITDNTICRQIQYMEMGTADLDQDPYLWYTKGKAGKRSKSSKKHSTRSASLN